MVEAIIIIKYKILVVQKINNKISLKIIPFVEIGLSLQKNILFGCSAN
jgi:hypothetical protein